MVYLYHLMGECIKQRSRKTVLAIIPLLLSVMICNYAVAQTASQTDQKRYSLSVPAGLLTQALKTVHQKTGIKSNYKSEDLRNITCTSRTFQRATLAEIMNHVLSNTALKWEYRNGEIQISRDRQSRVSQSSRTVTGTVTEINGEPLCGVTVSVIGTQTGTTTDVNGKYTIKVSSENPVILLYTFIGMKSVERTYKGNQKMNIVMEEYTTEVGEVVVTGYQTVSKREQASAITKVKLDDIQIAGQTSIDQMLGGQVPGMMVLQQSGEPGSAPKIRIRGTSSIIGARAPIWVLDGIILEDPVNVDVTNIDSPDASYLIGNAIAGVNARDIESITVLKDASATAIYGVRAANGVVVVTTKKGRSGKTQVNYSGNISLNQRINYQDLDLMNAGQRVKLSQEIIEDKALYSQMPINVGYEGLYMRYNNRLISADQFNSELSEMVSRNTDWYKILFRNSLSHNHTVSLNGGNDQTTFYGSIGYSNNVGTARRSGSESYTGMLKLNSWLSKRVNVRFQLNASKIGSDGFFSSVNPNEYAYNTSRAIPVRNADGTLFQYTTNQRNTTSGGKIHEELTYNILNEMKHTGASSDVMNMTAQLALNIDLFKGFRYRFLGGVDLSKSTKESWADEFSNYVSTIRGTNPGTLQPGTDAYDKSSLPVGGIYTQDGQRKDSYTLRNTIDYSYTLDQHLFSLMGVQEIRSLRNKGFVGTYYGYQPDRGMTIAPAITSEYKITLPSLSPRMVDYLNNNLSWLGTFSYSYSDRYTFSANVRSDGSNNFGDNPKYRFRPIWSVAGKYTLSNEKFMKRFQSFLSFFSIRASYGIQGNIDKSSTPNLIMQVGSKNNQTGLNESYFKYLANPDLRWEKTDFFNGGIDFAFGNPQKRMSLISGSVDIYRKKGKDMLTECTVSQSLGVGSTKINGGEILNEGIEGNLVITPFQNKDMDCSFTIIASYNRNKLLKASPQYQLQYSDQLAGTALVEGKPLGALYSLPYAHLNSENGYPMYYNNAGKLRYELMKDELALVYSGVNEPSLTGSFNINLRYKSLYLSLGFQYSQGGVARLPNIYGSNQYHALEPVRNVSKVYEKRWRKVNDITDIPKIINYEEFQDINVKYKKANNIVAYNTAYNNSEAYDLSDLRVVRTDNIRFRNLNLNYIFPRKIAHKLRLETLSASIQCQNLFLIADSQWGGRDPESGYSNTPLPRVYSLGINIGF